MAEPSYPDPATRNVIEAGCSRCPSLVESRERISWGNGSTNAAVMVVGEAPGAGNPDRSRWQGGNWTGLAYTAHHSGRIVRSLFDELGYGPDDLYVTNAVKCFPGDGHAGNREPTAEERQTCFAHLETEIEEVAPTVVVTTGKHATTALLEAEGIEREGFIETVLEPFDCPQLGVTVIPLLHPAYQAVWLSRLGYTRAGYLVAIEDALDRLV